VAIVSRTKGEDAPNISLYQVGLLLEGRLRKCTACRSNGRDTLTAISASCVWVVLPSCCTSEHCLNLAALESPQVARMYSIMSLDLDTLGS
jgi:hypothetical protein